MIWAVQAVPEPGPQGTTGSSSPGAGLGLRKSGTAVTMQVVQCRDCSVL